MLVENAAHHRKPQAGALLLGREKRLEDVRHVLLGNARAVIAHRHHRARVVALPQQVDRAAVGHRFACVLDQVEQAND